MKIYVTGPSGSGATTLGKTLSNRLNIFHQDSDDFFWLQTDPPFTTQRDADSLQDLFFQFAKLESFVLSGDVLGWGIPLEYLQQNFTHVLYLYSPWEIRKARIQLREKLRFGKRIMVGGDMNEQYEAFLDWASHYETGLKSGRNKSSQQSFVSEFKSQGGHVLEILDRLSPEETFNRAFSFLKQLAP